LKEGTATFLSLMVGASIALISQTYNIPGDTGTFILTWMLLIIPVTYIMQASLPAAIYLIGITSWAGTFWDDPVKAILFWPLAAIVMPHFIWALRREIYTLRTTILSLIIIVCVSIAAGFSLGKTWPGSWTIIFPSMFSIFYFTGCLNLNKITTNWQRPFRLVGGLGLFILAFQFTFRQVWRHLVQPGRFNSDLSSISAMPDHIITFIMIVTAILLFYHHVKRKNWTIALSGAVPLLTIAIYCMGDQSAIVPMFIFNVYLFILSITYIIFGVRGSNLTNVNTGMLILAILIMVRFFDSDIDFIIKGLVFIIIGVGFLTTNIILARRIGGAK